MSTPTPISTDVDLDLVWQLSEQASLAFQRSFTENAGWGWTSGALKSVGMSADEIAPIFLFVTKKLTEDSPEPFAARVMAVRLLITNFEKAYEVLNLNGAFEKKEGDKSGGIWYSQEKALSVFESIYNMFVGKFTEMNNQWMELVSPPPSPSKPKGP